MANTKEVRKQIASIKSTQKITSAMEMVAASKIKKTQNEMQLGRPYSEKIKEVISHIANSSSEYSHPFYEHRETKKACFLVVSSDKGLCGGLNINLFTILQRNEFIFLVYVNYDIFGKSSSRDFYPPNRASKALNIFF